MTLWKVNRNRGSPKKGQNVTRGKTALVQNYLIPKPLSSHVFGGAGWGRPGWVCSVWVCSGWGWCSWWWWRSRLWGPEGGAPRVGGAKKGGAPKGGKPQISRFFYLSRHIFLSFSLSLLGVLSGGFLKRKGPENVHVWSSRAVVCEPRRPGLVGRLDFT